MAVSDIDIEIIQFEPDAKLKVFTAIPEPLKIKDF